MQHLTASIPHRLTRAEAKNRIDEQVARLRTQPGSGIGDLETNWSNDTMQFSVRVLGQSLNGHLNVDDQAVHLTVALPWFMSLMGRSVQQKLEHGLREALNPPSDRPNAK